jgi:hypothetical protein
MLLLHIITLSDLFTLLRPLPSPIAINTYIDKMLLWMLLPSNKFERRACYYYELYGIIE